MCIRDRNSISLFALCGAVRLDYHDIPKPRHCWINSVTKEIAMKCFKFSMAAYCSLISLLMAVAGWAAEYPTPKEGDWVVRDFRFHTEEIVPELRLHYRTVGEPT